MYFFFPHEEAVQIICICQASQCSERNGALARPHESFYCCFIVFICAVLHLKENVLQKFCRGGMSHQGKKDITKDSKEYTVTHGQAWLPGWSEYDEVSQTNRLHMNDNEAENWCKQTAVQE